MADTIVIQNNLGRAAVYFLRAKTALDTTRVVSVSGSPVLAGSSHDLAVNAAYPGASAAPYHTYFFDLKQGESVTLEVAAAGLVDSAIVWAFLKSVPGITAHGPHRAIQAEFTIDPSVIYYDISAVEGVSSGITLEHKLPGAASTVTSCNPPEPHRSVYPSLAVATDGSFPTVLATKYTETDPYKQKLAACGSELADTACGQHRCRVYYAQAYQSGTSYSSWLTDAGAHAYTWALDEWMCKDVSCGWKGGNTPAQLSNDGLGSPATTDYGPPADNCTVPNQWNVSSNNVLWASNIYSCGFQPSLAPPSSWLAAPDASQVSPDGATTWWSAETGAYKKTVGGVDVLVSKPRGGNFKITFNNLEWVTGISHSTTPPPHFTPAKKPHEPIPHEGLTEAVFHSGSYSSKTRTIIGVLVVVVLAIIAAGSIFLLITSNAAIAKKLRSKLPRSTQRLSPTLPSGIRPGVSLWDL